MTWTLWCATATGATACASTPRPRGLGRPFFRDRGVPSAAVHHARGRWQEWNGQLYADFRRVDVSRLRHHADVGITVSQGRGAVRSWVDVERGQLVGGVADVALADVNATLGAQLQPLVLPWCRAGWAASPGGRVGVFTQKLQFTTQEGLRWPGGNVRCATALPARGQGAGEFQADLLDLAALSGIADRVPLGDAVHQALRTYTPQGWWNR